MSLVVCVLTSWRKIYSQRRTSHGTWGRRQGSSHSGCVFVSMRYRCSSESRATDGAGISIDGDLCGLCDGRWLRKSENSHNPSLRSDDRAKVWQVISRRVNPRRVCSFAPVTPEFFPDHKAIDLWDWKCDQSLKIAPSL
jgi:hypothetical protein